MAKKGNRIQVILECTEHKNSGLAGTSRYVTTKNKKNTLINSSRSIIYSSKDDDWIDNAAKEAQKINGEINNLQSSYEN